MLVRWRVTESTSGITTVAIFAADAEPPFEPGEVERRRGRLSIPHIIFWSLFTFGMLSMTAAFVSTLVKLSAIQFIEGAIRWHQ